MMRNNDVSAWQRAVKAVAELHAPVPLPETRDFYGRIVRHDGYYCEHCDRMWPCETIIALSEVIDHTL